MEKESLVEIKINYYSPTKAAIDFVSKSDIPEVKNMQLLLLSMLNYVNCIYTLAKENPSEVKDMIEEIDTINQSLLLDSQKVESSSFLRSFEKLIKSEARSKEHLIICLKQKGGRLFLEVDSKVDAELVYRLFSVFILFESVCETKDENAMAILSESIAYVNEAYSSNLLKGSGNSLMHLTSYFADLFDGFIG